MRVSSDTSAPSSVGRELVAAYLALLLAAATPARALEITGGPTLTLNPTGSTPLAAVIEVSTDVPSRVRLTVTRETDVWTVEFPDADVSHTVPVLGLKPNGSYGVELIVTDMSDGESVSRPLETATGPLPDDFPEMTLFASQPNAMEPGYILLDRFFRAGNEGPFLEEYTIIVDNAGDVVWYGAYGGQATLRQPDGTLLYLSDDSAVRRDLLGNVVSTLTLQDPGLALHHDLYPTEHGTYLSLTREVVIVEDFPTSETDRHAPTRTANVLDEPVVEFSQADGSLLNIWRLTELIDPTRIAYQSLSTNRRDRAADWAHDNAVVHDPRDDSIIVSVRHQDAVIKFSRATGDLIWILGPHDNWGAEFRPLLLDPVGTPFEWQYHQHAPMYTASGTLLLFDNGNFRASPFDGTVPLPAADSYSRAVEFEIDEQAMEVRQVWEYGTSAEPRLYSEIVGDADYLPRTGNRLIVFGGTSFTGGAPNRAQGLGRVAARVIEVNDATPAEKVFDLLLFNPDPDAWVAVYRAEKIPGLYPEGVLVSRVEGSRGAFLRGDTNADAKVDATDVVVSIDSLFPGFVLIPLVAGSDPGCSDAGDANDDGVRDLSDVVYLASFVFAGGPPPPAPFTGCGADPTPDKLTCMSLESCD